MKSIKAFNFEPGRVLNGKYKVLGKLGEGWEGQVYSIEELSTGIIRAAKFFYPERNSKNKTVIGYAKKLNALNDSNIVIKYITQEQMVYRGFNVSYLVSEYIDSYSLESYINSQPKCQLPLFEALHILYEITKGVEYIHLNGDFHGDIHSENILIRRKGLGFQVRLIDLFLWKGSRREFQKSDVVDLVLVFNEMLGGSHKYKNFPDVAKQIICGRKSNLISQKFPRISSLRGYLENIQW